MYLQKYHFYLYIYITSRNLSSQSILRMSTVFWTRARVFMVWRGASMEAARPLLLMKT